MFVLFCASFIPGQLLELCDIISCGQCWPVLNCMTSSAVVSVGQCWPMYASVTQCDLLLLFCIKSRLHVGLKLMGAWWMPDGT